MGSLCENQSNQNNQRPKELKRYPTLGQLQHIKNDKKYFSAIPIDGTGYSLKIIRILYDGASRCFIPNATIPSNKVSMFNFKLVKFSSSMMFGICTEKCFGVINPSHNRDLNAVNTFDGKIYNSGNAIWDKSFQRIFEDTEVTMKVDTINWRVDWIIKCQGKQATRSTHINQNMKKGSLYPTIIIKDENDMAELTVYE